MKYFIYFLAASQIFKSEGTPISLPEGDLKAARIFLEDLENSSQKGDLLPSVLSKDPTKGKEVSCDSSCCGSKSNDFGLHKVRTDYKNLIVFVSFSVGDSALKQLFRDVQKIRGQLVMRGLYKNSFRQTQKKIQDLKIVVDIDPTLFERFQIQEVPTFVITKGLEREQIPPHDHLKGNVSLAYALEIFEQEGHKEANRWLNKLRGIPDV